MQKKNNPADADTPSCRGRGRPRAFDREAALAKATQLFWTKGYSATSISDLTEAMGIGSPSLYAAFGSKDALYAEALNHYRDTYEAVAWKGFFKADTARAAVATFLHDSARGMSQASNGCMATLSAVGAEGHTELGKLVASARNDMFDRIRTRLEQGVAAGEIPASVDTHGLARFVQGVQNGMSILARDGATGEELAAIAETAMMGWDARVNAQPD
jgi:AcrR family transcriptional regulator